MSQAEAPLREAGQDPDYIDNWDEYFANIAVAVSRKSKDPRCRVGAVIVRDKLLLSTGFNGFARQVFDDPALLSDTAEKLKRICHAEQNAILNSARLGVALEGATIYVTKFPCLACCNAIVQAGIREIHTDDTKYWNDDPLDADHSRKKSILRQADIKVVAPFHPDYAPRRVTGKATHLASVLPSDATEVPAVVPPAQKPKRTKKSKRGRARDGKTLGLFSGREAGRGGKSEG